jgi:hypothetical protein
LQTEIEQLKADRAKAQSKEAAVDASVVADLKRQVVRRMMLKVCDM